MGDVRGCMERRIRISSLILPAASWMSVDGRLTSKISRAASFINTAIKSGAIQPRLWVAWFEGVVRVRKGYIIQLSKLHPVSGHRSGTSLWKGHMHNSIESTVFPAHLSLVHLELFSSPVPVSRISFIMHATEVLRPPRLTPESGHDLPGCDAVTVSP